MKKIQRSSSSSSIIQHQSPSWSDLDMDMLREINKKLCNYADHLRFRGVCKSWRTVEHDEKRAADVLPWLMLIGKEATKKLLYKLYEPHSHDPIKSDTCLLINWLIALRYVNKLLYELPHSIKSDDTSKIIISHSINLDDYFDHTDNPDDDDLLVSLVRYVDGWLHISIINIKSYSSNLLLFSLATKSSFTLPQLNFSTLPLFLVLSTTPDSPDCVFLALSFIDDYLRTISIFRHGDTDWTTTQSVGGWFGKPIDNKAVVIQGVSYFLTSRGIGSYDLATEVLKVDHYSTVLEYFKIYNFFGLDGDLMLTYFENKNWKLCLRKYDWSNKAWVPLQSLGDRSLYLSRYSVYVDQINYYGISSANKTYVRVINRNCSVEEYTLEDGRLSKYPSPTLRSWGDPCYYYTRVPYGFVLLMFF